MTERAGLAPEESEILADYRREVAEAAARCERRLSRMYTNGNLWKRLHRVNVYAGPTFFPG